MELENLNIYCDMDGVLANFNGEKNALQRFKTEKGFFKKLKPIKSNIKALNELIKKNVNVFILSASPNTQADNDKRAWLHKYLPNLKQENIIIMRVGQNKADFVKTTENNLLIDDYSKNCFDFIHKGYQACMIAPYKTIKRLLHLE